MKFGVIREPAWCGRGAQHMAGHVSEGPPKSVSANRYCTLLQLQGETWYGAPRPGRACWCPLIRCERGGPSWRTSDLCKLALVLCCTHYCMDSIGLNTADVMQISYFKQLDIQSSQLKEKLQNWCHKIYSLSIKASIQRFINLKVKQYSVSH